MPFKFSVVRDDVRTVAVDLLLLKYADGHRGADFAVSNAIGMELAAPDGEYRVYASRSKVAAKEVISVGVGHLADFDYTHIQRFAERAVRAARTERPFAKTLGITIHGPGYGLDELASIDSLIRGIRSTETALDQSVEIKIIEIDEKRARRVEEYLEELASDNLRSGLGPNAAQSLTHGGAFSKRLFAAMPFKSEYLDHWELAFLPAAHDNHLVIERLDKEHFTGDIVSEIRNRIGKAEAVIALLDSHNPNVFLEVGYAWALGKPTVLVLKEGEEAPFDVRAQKIIRYNRLGELKTSLTFALERLLSPA